jgi:hypothetical protein
MDAFGVIRKGRAPLVKGTPSQTAKLRPLRNPLYDKEKMANGVAQTRLELFVNRRQFADGTNKNLNDTNMQGDGVLGVPLEFDFIGLTGKLDYGTDIVDINGSYNEGALEWFFHQSVPWLQLPLTELPSGTGAWGFTTEAATTIFNNGIPALTNFWNMTDHLRQSRHILSMESFKGVITFPETFTPGADVFFKMVMLGILYAAL